MTDQDYGIMERDNNVEINEWQSERTNGLTNLG